MIANKARISFARNVWQRMFERTHDLFLQLTPSHPHSCQLDRSNLQYSTYRVKKRLKERVLRVERVGANSKDGAMYSYYSTNTVLGRYPTYRTVLILWNKILLIRYSFQDISKELCPDSPGTIFQIWMRAFNMANFKFCLFYFLKYL
jgi:hypothetical protein